MGVGVDDPGGHDEAGGVDLVGGAGAVEVGEPGDVPVADPDVDPAAGQAVAVHDLAVADDEVEVGAAHGETGAVSAARSVGTTEAPSPAIWSRAIVGDTPGTWTRRFSASAPTARATAASSSATAPASDASTSWSPSPQCACAAVDA